MVQDFRVSGVGGLGLGTRPVFMSKVQGAWVMDCRMTFK